MYRGTFYGPLPHFVHTLLSAFIATKFVISMIHSVGLGIVQLIIVLVLYFPFPCHLVVLIILVLGERVSMHHGSPLGTIFISCIPLCKQFWEFAKAKITQPC